jgi:hypothetical protein
VSALLAEGATGVGHLLKERVDDLDELARALHEVAAEGRCSTRSSIRSVCYG